jgi:hypothetical protein
MLVIHKTGNVLIKVTFRRVCITTIAMEKQYTYSEHIFIDLVIQHAKGLRRIKLSSVVSPVLPDFSNYSLIKAFRKKCL